MGLRIGFVIANHAGHINAAIGVAQRCARAGHAVFFVGEPEQGKRIAGAAMSFLPAEFIKPLDPPWRRESSRVGILGYRRLAARRIAEAGDTVRRALDMVRRERLDLMVYDPFLLGYHAAFGACGIPALALGTKPLLDHDAWVPPYSSSLIPKPGMLGEAQVRLAWAGAWLSYAAFKLKTGIVRAVTGYSALRFCGALARHSGYDLKQQWRCRPISFDFALRDVVELVLQAEELDFPRKWRPRRARYVGPCTRECASSLEFDWGSESAGQLRILCAVSTESAAQTSEQVRFLRRVIEAFRHHPNCRLVVAAGNQAARLAVSVPRHIRLEPALPLQAALRDASVCIAHGGANSLKEAIGHGVPLVLYPSRADQPGNAARAVFAGLALRGSRRDSPSEIRRKVLRVAAAPEFRQRASVMREVFERYDRDAICVRFIEAVAANRGHRVDNEPPEAALAGGVSHTSPINPR